MIALLMFGALVWFILQASTEKNQEKWKRRFMPLLPVGRYVRADAIAVYRMIRAHLTFHRERKRAGDWDITEIY